MALTISLLITCATSLQNLMVVPDSVAGAETLTYTFAEQRFALLAFVALWGMKLFVDDNQCLVPGKSIPAFDVLFLIVCHGALICAAALITESGFTATAILIHYAALFFWNLSAMAVPTRANDAGKWLIIDAIVSFVLVVIACRGELNVSNWYLITFLYAVLVIDTGLSKTLRSSYLVGKEVDLG